MTKSVSKQIDVAAPTQLDGATDKTVKKSKSAKRVNSSKSLNTAAPANTEEAAKDTQPMVAPTEIGLFDGELVPSIESEGTDKMKTTNPISSVRSTDSKDESVELKTTNSRDEKKSSDCDVAFDSAPPMQPSESNSTPKADSSEELNSMGESGSETESSELTESAESNSKTETNPVDESTSIPESKPTRVSAKMRRQELDDYVEQFLKPGQIAKRHTVVIEKETWDRISYNVRKIGLADSTGSAYVEAIIRDHLDRYKDKVEEWRKL